MFDNVIFTDECSVQLDNHSRLCFRKRGHVRKFKPRPKHPIKVHVWAGISRCGTTSHHYIFHKSFHYCNSSLSAFEYTISAFHNTALPTSQKTQSIHCAKSRHILFPAAHPSVHLTQRGPTKVFVGSLISSYLAGKWFLAVLTHKYACDRLMVSLLHACTLGNSSYTLRNNIMEIHSKEWLRKQLQYLTDCDCHHLGQQYRSGPPVVYRESPPFKTLPTFN